VVVTFQQQMQGQQHLPLPDSAATCTYLLQLLLLWPATTPFTAAAMDGINASRAAGLMSVTKRLPSSNGHMHSGRSSLAWKTRKVFFPLMC